MRAMRFRRSCGPAFCPTSKATQRAAIGVLARPDVTWQAALDRIAAATERVRAWHPGSDRLACHVAAAFDDEEDRSAPSLTHDELVNAVWQLAQGRVPSDIEPLEAFEEQWDQRIGGAFYRYDSAMKNFVAARLFANWVAYQGQGLRSIVQWGRAAAALVRHHALRRALGSSRATEPDDFIEAIRMADLLLLHVIDTEAFARTVAPLEFSDGARSTALRRGSGRAS